jgi:Concanavalin A-like lectin/glucanases superfamily/Carbohydrate binding domain
MSLNHSPKIVTDGLVFCYDMGNTKKSWKGKPTTNILTSPTNFSWLLYNNTAAGANSSASNETQPDGIIAKVITVTGSSGASNDIQAYSSTYSLSANTTYTVSCMFYSNTSFNISLGAIQNGSPWASYIPLTTITVSPGWNYIQSSGSYPLSVTDARFQIFLGTAPIGTTIKLLKPQIEIGSFATPFVNGTRLNTESIKDLTLSNIVTSNSLTYAIDGSFSFNGTSNYITIPQPAIQVSPNRWTISGWIKPNVNHDSFFLTPQSAGVDHFLALTVNAAFRVSITETSDVNNRTYYSPNGSVPAGVWTHFSVSIDNLTLKLFINGVQYINQTETISIAGWTGNWILGQRGNSTYWLNGSISSLSVYDRVLSDSEVKQNFNALRGRYGV